MERHELYIDDAIAGVEVKPYSVKPVLFDAGDLSKDADNWLNLAVAQYYRKASVRIVDE